MNALLGMAVLAAMVLCGIGATGYLIYDHHYLFAIAEVVAFCFAFKPMKEFIEKNLSLWLKQ